MKELPRVGVNGNLIPLNLLTKDKQREIQSKGGSVTGYTKSLGQRIRWLKKKGMCDENAQWLYGVIKNKELCYLEILNMIKEMYMKAEDINEINLVVKNMIQLSKQMHGQKFEVEGDIHREIDNSVHITIEKWSSDGKQENKNTIQTSSQTIDVSPVKKEV